MKSSHDVLNDKWLSKQTVLEVIKEPKIVKEVKQRKDDDIWHEEN